MLVGISEDPGSILSTDTSIPRDLTPSSGPKDLRSPPTWYTDKTFKQTIRTHKIIITIIILLPPRRRGHRFCTPLCCILGRRLGKETDGQLREETDSLKSTSSSHFFKATSLIKRLHVKQLPLKGWMVNRTQARQGLGTVERSARRCTGHSTEIAAQPRKGTEPNLRPTVSGQSMGMRD